MIRKTLKLLALTLAVGALLALIGLLKQKNRALEDAQKRIASIEQRMNEIMASISEEGRVADLRNELTQQRAELERLHTELAALHARTACSQVEPAIKQDVSSSSEAPAQTQASESYEDAAKTSERIEQRADAGLEMLSAFPAAKQRFVECALKANIAPTLIERPQTLSAIDGIGPIFEQRLYNAGIGTYWEVATLDDETLRRILQLSKARAALVRFDTIRASAQRLAEETQTVGSIWNSEPVDDFDMIPGIGEVYKRRLYDAGIRTYAALANATPELLEQACASRSPVPPDYAGWIEAARKLATGRSGNESNT